ASATWASLTQQASCSSQMARGYLMGLQACSGMAAIAALTFGSIRTVTEKHAPAARTALVNAADKRRVRPHHQPSAAPGGAGRADRSGGEPGRAAGRVRVAAAQPGGRAHRHGPP